MANEPSKRDLLRRAANEDNDTSRDRRRVLQSGVVAAVGSVLGISSLSGAATADSGSDFEVMQRQADMARLEDARPLLSRLSEEGLISTASADAFQDAPLGTHESGTATLRYGDRVVHTYVVRRDGSKLTVNLAEGDRPHAIYAPDGSGPGDRVRFDQIGETVETQKMTYTRDASTSDDGCGDYCGGTTCSPAGNCWLSDRECTESCRQDDAGDHYCHDDCQCGCN